MSAATISHGTQAAYWKLGCRCTECEARGDRDRADARERARRRREEQPEKVRAEKLAEYQRNKDRYRATSQRWKKLNRERVRELDHAWRLTPKGRRAEYERRGRRWGMPFTEEALDWIASLVDPTCAYCDAPADTIDHIVPISSGGTGERSNLNPACHFCNTSKGGTPLDEWLASRSEAA